MRSKSGTEHITDVIRTDKLHVERIDENDWVKYATHFEMEGKWQKTGQWDEVLRYNLENREPGMRSLGDKG